MQTPIATETKARTFEQRHLQIPRSARYAILGSLEADLSPEVLMQLTETAG